MRVITQLMSPSLFRAQSAVENYGSLPKPQLRVHFGMLYYLREARLRYFFSDSSNLGIAKEAAKLLLHELRCRFLATFVFLWLCLVLEFDDKENECLDLSANFDEDEIWISRQAVLGGIKPHHLDETIDYDFLRNVFKVKIRVWGTSNSKTLARGKGDLPYSQKIQIEEPFQSENIHSHLQLISLEKTEIHHGKFITLGSKLIPLSFEQCNPSVSWPTDSYVKTECSHYIMQSTRKTFLSEAIFIGESSSWYHFIVEFLPRYLSIPVDMRNVPIVISKNTKKQIIEILATLGFSNLILTDNMETIAIDKLTTVMDFRPISRFDLSARRADLVKVRNTFRDIEINRNTTLSSVRILILRRNNTFRRLGNERDLVQMLKPFGFVVIYPETLSFSEQLSIFRSAQIVVGQSGAALTSLIFCNKNTKCFELGDWVKGEEQFFWRDFANQIDLPITPIYSQPKSHFQKISDTFECDVESLISKLGELT